MLLGVKLIRVEASVFCCGTSARYQSQADKNTLTPCPCSVQKAASLKLCSWNAIK